jgi:hypothetical protein
VGWGSLGKMAKSCHIARGKKKLESPHLFRQWVPTCWDYIAGTLNFFWCCLWHIAKIWSQYRAGIQFFLMSSLTCSQIWLSPLVDDRQLTNLTKLEKKEAPEPTT